MAYQAIVATVLNTEPIPGCDNIHVAMVSGYRVIVPKSTTAGDVGLFFEAGGQLSEAFAKANDLIARKDEHGNRAGGFFEVNRRVRAIKMKATKSEGFFCPVSHLVQMVASEPTGDMVAAGVQAAMLKPGDAMNSFCNIEVCNKYETESTKQWAKEKRLRARRETEMFRCHTDTEPFKKMMARLPESAVIYITEKLHGTSQRVGRVLDEVEVVGFWKRLWRKIRRRPTADKLWMPLIGTRNVILKNRVGGGFHGSEEFREIAVEPWIHSLHKGEVIYGEVVGYTENGGPIMSPQESAKLKDPTFVKRYGTKVTYSYGCQPGEFLFYAYRITQVNEDGKSVELSWPQVQRRAGELGIPTVPLLERLVYGDDADVCSAEQLLTIVEAHVEPQLGGVALASTVDDSHPREGVCVRFESQGGTETYKLKSQAFGMLEGYLKDNPNLVDLEEAA